MTMLDCKPLISIIVPIYNTELYLNDCLTSLSAQSYKNIEILLVNDGSTDNSKRIAEHYVTSESRAKLISQPNAGVAAARNSGLDSATGELIIHADSDDILPSDAIETLYASMLESGSDIALGDYIVRYPRKDVLVNLNFSGDHEEFLIGFLKGTYHAGLWNKLIKRSLYDKLQFDVGLDFMEDKLMLAKIFSNNDIRVSYIDKPVYIYRRRLGSYTNTISQKSLVAGGIVTDKICAMFEVRYGLDFVVNLRNKNRIFVLMNDPRLEKIKETDKFILDDQEIAVRHKVLLWFILRGITSPLKLYKFIQSLIAVRV